jgi:hypothetical protein
MVTHCGLCDVQLQSRSRKAAGLDNGFENIQLMQVHFGRRNL